MISIFASRLWRSRAPDRHLTPISSIIRGQQVAEFLGARLNPRGGFARDLCIFVKRTPPERGVLARPPVVDIVDGWGLCPVLADRPEAVVLACSRLDEAALSRCLPNRVVFLPQHSCNFERQRRIRSEVTVLGAIGTYGAWRYLPEGLEEELAIRGMRLWRYSEFTCREDVVRFYLGIDLQLVWRPYSKHLSNPLKLVNAASFGVPTLAWEEPAFEEMRGSYWPVETREALLAGIDSLRASPQRYADYADRGLALAEAYHLDKVGELYKELDQ